MRDKNKPIQLMRLLALWLVNMLIGCTSLGAHDPMALKQVDFGPEETLRICVLVDQPEVTEAQAVQIMMAVQQEMAIYGIRVEVPFYEPWQRPGNGSLQIIKNLAARKLAPPCDRILALAGDNLVDMLIGLLGVSELGSVDTVTHTRGYVLSEFASLNQVFAPPQAAAIHEIYHLLGCEHATTMSTCYEQIATLKAAAHKNRAGGHDFFPTTTVHGQLMLRRADVDVLESMALRVTLAKEQAIATP